MRKPRAILTLLIPLLIGNAVVLFQMVSTTSMEKNALVWGFSFSKLIIIGLATLGMAVNAAVLAALFLKQRWIETRLAQWDLFFKDSPHANLLFTSGCISFLLEISYLLLAAVSPQVNLGSLSGFLQRGTSLVYWACLVTLSALLGVFFHYKNQIVSRSTWQDLFNQLKNTPRSIWLLSVVLFLAGAVMLAFSPAFAGRIPRHDSGIFLYFGSRILKGDIPFHNLWDHKPPLIFYIDALGLLLFNHSVWGVWFLEVLSLVISILCLFVLLRKELRASAVFLALVGLVAAVVMVLEGGNLTEEYGLPMQCLCLWLFCQFALKGKYVSRTLFLNGVTLGLAVMLKQTLIGVWAALWILSLTQIFSKEKRVRLKDFFWFACGLILVLAAWISYFAYQNSLWDFWDVAYRFNFIYSDITWADRLNSIRTVFWVFFNRSWFLCFGFLSWVGYVVLALFYRITQNAKKYSMLLWAALIDLPIEIALISLSGENYDHYFFTILPCMTILIAFAWNDLLRMKWFAGFLRQTAVYLLLMIAIIASPIKQVVDAYRQPVDQLTTATVEYIQSATLPSDYVLLWGDQALINFASGRDSPTRFVHQKALFRSGYASPQLSQEMLNDLERKKPVLIIDTRLPSIPFLKKAQDGQCVMPDGLLPLGIPQVFLYICDHYDLMGEVGGKDHWQVYRLRP
jgi:hypothetical protein